MGLGLGLFLVAIGAILAWAVNVDISGVDVTAVGYILLVVGAIAILLSLAFWSSWAGPGYYTRRRRYVDEAPPGY
jgi:hypothetical protein